MFQRIIPAWYTAPGRTQPIRHTPSILLAMWQELHCSPLEWVWQSELHGVAMVAGVVGGGIMRSTSIIVDRTILRGIITTIPIVRSPKQGIRIGSITRSTGGMPSTGIRQRHRSMGSSVRVPGAGRAHQTPGATAAAQGAPEGLKRATSAVAQAQEAVEGLKRAT